MKLRVGLILVSLLSLGACAPRQAEPSAEHDFVINGKIYPPIEEPSSGRPVAVMPPNYPQKAHEDQREGFVDFEFTLTPDGKVENPRVLREAPVGYGFAREAALVFRDFRFHPQLIDGKPTAVISHYRMTFRLARS